jgi:aminoglycoside phosphotransferase (APT) family kinase protein
LSAGTAASVRHEDAIDAGSLNAWLSEHLPELPRQAPQVLQFSSGASNLTYLLRYPERDLVLRRPPRGARAGTAHDVAREYEIQRRLRPNFPYVPTVLALCEDEAVLGAPFYVMERIDGVVPGRTLPEGLEGSQAQALGERFVAILAALHTVDVDGSGLEVFSRGPGYVRRQVEQWCERFRHARTRNVPDFERVMAWLERSQPPDVGHCLIHNDYRLDNLVLDAADPSLVKGVLDWELATVGDPMMDLGSTLAYWVQSDDGILSRRLKVQASDASGLPTRSELVRRYGELTGIRVENWTFYLAFGLFRLAGIMQQLYHRYRTGATTNPKLRLYWVGVHLIHRRCRELMRSTG